MKIVNLPRFVGGHENPEWIAWTLGGIGAPEAAAVMGLSRFDTPAGIAASKLGLSAVNLVKNPPGRGNTRVESRLRSELESRTGLMLLAACGEHSERSYIRAVFDGLSHDGAVAEVRAPSEKVYGEIEKDGLQAVPEHVLYVKHQLLVSGGPIGHLAYASPQPGKPDLFFEIALQDDERARLLDAYEKFWTLIEQGDTPPLDPAKDIFRESQLDGAQKEAWERDCKELRTIQTDIEAEKLKIKGLEDREAALLQRLFKDMKSFTVAEVFGVRVSRFVKAGSIDYKAIVTEHLPALSDGDKEKYRRKGSKQTRVTHLT
jgi:predicted phage-related endonuclease